MSNTWNITSMHEKLLGPYYTCYSEYHIVLYILFNRRSSDKRRHVKTLVEALVAVERKTKARIIIKSGSVTSTNLIKRIIRESIITL